MKSCLSSMLAPKPLEEQPPFIHADEVVDWPHLTTMAGQWRAELAQDASLRSNTTLRSMACCGLAEPSRAADQPTGSARVVAVRIKARAGEILAEPVPRLAGLQNALKLACKLDEARGGQMAAPKLFTSATALIASAQLLGAHEPMNLLCADFGQEHGPDHAITRQLMAFSAAHDVLSPPYRLKPAGDAHQAAKNHFRVRARGQDLFVKIEGMRSGVPPVAELQACIHAARLGISPQAYLAASAPFAIVTDFMPKPTLTFAQTQQTRVRMGFVDVMRTLHLAPAVPDAPVAQGFGLAGWDAWSRQDLLARAPNRHLFAPQDLQRHMSALQEGIRTGSSTRAYTHYDTLRRNMFWHRHRLVLADWGLARVGDPIRDLAKFFGFNHLMPEDAPAVLRRYYHREPTPQELRHLLLWLQAMSLDHYAYKICSRQDRQQSLQRKAEHIQRLAHALPDLPRLPRLHRPGAGWEPLSRVAARPL